MPTDAAKLDDQLCFALYSASSRLTAIYRPLLEPLGLTYPQFVVMMALWELDGVSITALAKTTNLSKATTESAFCATGLALEEAQQLIKLCQQIAPSS